MFFHSLLVSSEEADLSDRWQMPPARYRRDDTRRCRGLTPQLALLLREMPVTLLPVIFLAAIRNSHPERRALCGRNIYAMRRFVRRARSGEIAS
jgi:hypothetical protein